MRHVIVTLLLASITLFIGCTDYHHPVEVERPHAHFNGFRETAISHTLLITRLTLGSDTLPSGWEIGVFTPAGVLSGRATWEVGDTMKLVAYGADDEVDQFHNGDYFVFKGWNPETGEEKVLDGYFALGYQSNWIAGGRSLLFLDVPVISSIEVRIERPWQLVSINVQPLSDKFITQGSNIGKPDIRLMNAEIAPKVLLVKDERGRFYAPRGGPPQGFNNIPYWDVESGYEYRMSEPAIAHWEGTRIPVDTEIPVKQGWSVIAFYPTYKLSCQYPDFKAIESISLSTAVVEDDEGHFAYPRFGFSNMSAWEPGRAYRILVGGDVVLRYPPQEAALPSPPINDSLLTTGPWQAPRPTGASLLLLITGIRDVVLNRMDVVAAFSSDGTVVGLGWPVGQQVGLAIWGDDFSTDAVDGLQGGELFTLKYWNSDRDQVQTLRADNFTRGNSLEYRGDVTVCSTYIH